MFKRLQYGQKFPSDLAKEGLNPLNHPGCVTGDCIKNYLSQIKNSNLIKLSVLYAKASSEFAGPIFARRDQNFVRR